MTINEKKIKVLLEKKKRLLYKEQYDYLNTLLNLEVPVLNNKELVDKYELYNDSLYQNIEYFNIYMRTLNILNKNNAKVKKGTTSIYSWKEMDEDIIDLYDLNYNKGDINITLYSFERNEELIHQEYLNALEPDIRKHYEEELNVSELVGENQISPDGYALGILFIYPDLP